MDFFNIIYYYTVDDIKERKRMEIIYKKYKPHVENIDFISLYIVNYEAKLYH
jgi:hypothetical protein